MKIFNRKRKPENTADTHIIVFNGFNRQYMCVSEDTAVQKIVELGRKNVVFCDSRQDAMTKIKAWS